MLRMWRCVFVAPSAGIDRSLARSIDADMCGGGMGFGITLPRDDNEVKYGEKGEGERERGKRER